MKKTFILSASILIMLAATDAAAETPAVKVDSDTISGLGARNIGSAAMSGRITSIAGVHEGQRLTIYVGSASGGVWKTVKGGARRKPLFAKQNVETIAAHTLESQKSKTICEG